MAKEPRPLDISHMPELLSLAQQVRDTQEPCLLRRESEDLAILIPIKSVAKRGAKGKTTSADDPLWEMVGIGHSGGPGDVSVDKHKYLADAYLHYQKQA